MKMTTELLDKLKKIKANALVFDIETWSQNPATGEEYDIRFQFDEYVKFASCRWFGAYSYKYDEEYMLPFIENRDFIEQLLKDHDILVGFNSKDFDFRVLKGNGVVPEKKRYIHTDMLEILGTDVDVRKQKNRASLMGVSLPSNSLQVMAESFGLDTLKEEIDYRIFKKTQWTDEEKKEIIRYLKADVYATKELFDRTWEFWKIFTLFLDERNIQNLSWTRSSIASLTYKSACFVLGVPETYSDEKGLAEDMGGRVIEPKYQDARDVWYIDFTSLYPHIMAMFELFTQIKPEVWCNKIRQLRPELSSKTDEELLEIGQKASLLFHKNNYFESKGWYDISKMSVQNKDMRNKLELRIEIKTFLKKLDENNYYHGEIPEVLREIVSGNQVSKEEVVFLNSLMYAVKIYLNSYYGAFRSKTFEAIHQKDGGWDTCWIGQQLNELIEMEMKGFGFETIGGDTDSIFILATKPEYNNKEYVQECLAKIIAKINDNVPFPCKTFNLDIEGGDKLDYIKWAFDYKKDKESGQVVRVGKKKNYIYIQNGKAYIKGLPIKKSNATRLGKYLLDNYLIEKIQVEGHANFSEEYLKGIVENHVSAEMMAIRYNCKPPDMYKAKSHINCQISMAYTQGLGGTVYCVKNKKIGKAGNAVKRVKQGKPLTKSNWFYGLVEECNQVGVTVQDLDMTKTYNELSPFFEEDAYLR